MKPKGGRGHTAPYATVMVRTPVPLKNQVKELIERYQECISAGGDPHNPPRLLEAIASNKPVDKFQHSDKIPMWQVGDLCACIQPSGVIIPQVEIRSFNALTQSCKVYDQSTDSHWSAKLNELMTIPVYKLLEKVFKQNQVLEQQLAEAQGEINFQEDRWRLTEKQNKGLAKEIREKRKPVDSIKPLNLTQLMQRLGQNSRGYAQRIRLDHPKFLQWSRSHDPQGIGWQFDEDSKLCNPVL